MTLILVKAGYDVLIGEYRGRLYPALDAPLENPMRNQEVEMVQASALNPRQSQKVAGFRLVPLPCSEILFTHVDYFGELKKTDPVYTTYYKVLEAVREQAKDPLMVAQ